MMTMKIIQRRKNGKFAKRADVYMYDRRDPGGVIYAECENLEHARKVVAHEVACFASAGMTLRVIQ